MNLDLLKNMAETYIR
ncbi:hypothetical protein CGLO_11805 [Colletotrichum gloeosporioides Cg-14]|uniref:Uncharacterized protein n=1 Tax=Colletotrichum gloeosporioides (strain Cg-14) TaxID=1237896 RepID=T0KA88_COLGC|nr:hypothetical protein CGLO_11805 [Colletotrichum gloeosporioides Cg-14]